MTTVKHCIFYSRLLNTAYEASHFYYYIYILKPFFKIYFPLLSWKDYEIF